MKAFFAIVLFCLTTSVVAQQDEQRRPHREPPQEAIDACDGYNENDTVSFTTPRGDTLEATCKLVKDTLIAVPLEHKRRGKRSEQSQ